EPQPLAGRHRKAKLLLVKLDPEPITHSEDVAVVFPAISDPVFGQQRRVNFIPPRLGIGKHAIEVEDHSAERLRYHVPHLLPKRRDAATRHNQKWGQNLKHPPSCGISTWKLN